MQVVDTRIVPPSSRRRKKRRGDGRRLAERVEMRSGQLADIEPDPLARRASLEREREEAVVATRDHGGGDIRPSREPSR